MKSKQSITSIDLKNDLSTLLMDRKGKGKMVGEERSPCKHCEKDLQIVRVGDGKNFRNSKKNIWAMKDHDGGVKTTIEKWKIGETILCFAVSKDYGGIISSFSTYTGFADRKKEQLVKLNTYTNEDLGFSGSEEWDIQIHYTNLYNTERQNLKATFIHPRNVFSYISVKGQNVINLTKEYNNFVKYAEPQERK